jgi:hypothetical protein
MNELLIICQLAIHRADLHKALLDAATSPRGTGTPVKVLLGQKVASVVSICLQDVHALALIGPCRILMRVWS